MAHRFGSTDALLQQTWNSMLQDQSQEGDFISNLVGTYSDKDQELPDEAIMRVNLAPGAKSHTIGILLDLEGAGRMGAGKILTGWTEDLRVRDYTVYANDVRHGVNKENYGLYAHYDKAYPQLMNTINKKLGNWLSARNGKHARQGMLERLSDNLEESPTSLTSGWNKNWLVKNVAWTSQPSYNSTASQFDLNIQNAFSAAGTGANTAVDPTFFTDLELYCSNVWKIPTFADGTRVCTVPADQAVYLKRFNAAAPTTENSFADLMRNASVKKYVEAAYGQYLTQIGKFHLIVDDRAPIIDYDTSAGTITAYYRDVGSTDDRSSHTNGTNNRIFNIGFVMGPGALTQVMAMPPRYDNELTDFNRLESIGIATTYGYMATEFDATTATSSTRINQNSAVWAAYSGSPTA